MLEDLIGTYGSRFAIAIAGVAVALLGLVIVLRLVRNRAPSPFLRGGRNRQPRLQILDAAAVDARRRLVLVRRDDVEHLIMIGGPTDVVIESRIGERQQAAAPPARHEDAFENEPPVEDSGHEETLYATQPADDHRQERLAARAIPPATPLQLPLEQPAEHLSLGGAGPAAEWRRLAQAAEAARPLGAQATEKDASARPVARTVSPVESPVSDAASILDAARSRVLSRGNEAGAGSSATAIGSKPSPAVNVSPVETQDVASAFEKILEDEMAATLEAAKTATPRPITPSVAPRRNPDLPPASAGDPEQRQVQKEMERIFGNAEIRGERR